MRLPAIPVLILLVLCAIVMQMAGLMAHETSLEKSGAQPAMQAGTSLAVPEPSSALLIGALGLMLMLRRRRMQA